MSNAKSVLLRRTALALVLLGPCLEGHAQSPYGLAARQSIPLVIEERDDRGLPVWTTEITIHNPGIAPITVRLDLFTTVGQIGCTAQTVAAGGTDQVSLVSACPALVPVCCAPSYGRLELNALPPPASLDPAGVVFLAKARLSGPGNRSYTVEGFPHGNLSGNKSFAAVTGLKSGLVGGSQWRTFCYAESLDETPQVWVKLVDGNGAPVGLFSAMTPPLVPSFNPIDGFGADVFTAVGAPFGNFNNVTALFSTAPFGGAGGAAAFGFCRIVNVTQNQEAFEIAKYIDNNDEGRQHQNDVSETSFGESFSVFAETDEGFKESASNLHVAYFQHPDRIRCSVRFDVNPSLGFHSDFGQMRLVDEAGNVVAGGPGVTTFQVDLGEKSTQYTGQNRRWVIEVGPQRTIKSGGGFQTLHSGGLQTRKYTLSCSSGNGHNQLDPVGHCRMACAVDKTDKDFFLCGFDGPPLNPARCSY
jgi:hypothetical protein